MRSDTGYIEINFCGSLSPADKELTGDAGILEADEETETGVECVAHILRAIGLEADRRVEPASAGRDIRRGHIVVGPIYPS